VGGSGVALGSGIGSGVGSGIDDVGGALGGDAFELGDATTDDESASVVVATEDSGDSSFFGTVSDDSGSVSLEDASPAALIPGDDGFLEGAAGPPFSALQIVGLVCCTLLLLTAALVMIDLVWSIRTPAGTPISSPLLKALTDLFSWRPEDASLLEFGVPQPSEPAECPASFSCVCVLWRCVPHPAACWR
jgi:hypothetical protein